MIVKSVKSRLVHPFATDMCFEQGKEVEVAKRDSWVDSQLKRGLLVSVGGSTTRTRKTATKKEGNDK